MSLTLLKLNMIALEFIAPWGLNNTTQRLNVIQFLKICLTWRCNNNWWVLTSLFNIQWSWRVIFVMLIICFSVKRRQCMTDKFRLKYRVSMLGCFVKKIYSYQGCQKSLFLKVWLFLKVICVINSVENRLEISVVEWASFFGFWPFLDKTETEPVEPVF